MSMAMLLEGVRDYLRTNNDPPFGFDPASGKDHCGIQIDGMPPPTARSHYLALDESTVTGTNDSNYYHGETYEISAYVCRNILDKPRDRQNIELLKDDIYLASMQTLEKMEREVIVALHQNYALTTAINTQFSLPDATLGDVFLEVLRYRGRGRTTAVTVPDSQAVFHRRELRFGGIKRNQRKGMAG